MRIQTIIPSVLGLACGLAFGACTHKLPNHCSNLGGDQTCAERGGPQFCNGCVLDNDGCVAEMPGVDCYYEGDSQGSSGTASTGLTSTGPQESTTDIEPTGSSDSSDSTTGDDSCRTDEDCTTAQAPVCGAEGLCESCDTAPDPNAACVDTDPAAPVCSGGVCVQCTTDDPSSCEGDTPICDAIEQLCVGCSEHSQCPDTACHEAEGSCFPAESVWTVDQDGGGDFLSIGEALAEIPSGGVGTIIVREFAAPYTEALTIDGGRVVALRAETVSEGTRPRIGIAAVSGALIDVTGGSTLYVDGLDIRSNTDGLGVRVQGSTLYLDRAVVADHDQGSLVVEMDSTAVVRNSMVGGDVNDVAAINSSASDLAILYSTIGAGFGSSAALTCTGGTVAVRNSILVSRSDNAEIACPGAEVAFTASETAIAGEGNETIDDLDTMWFTNYGQGNLRLSTDGAAVFQDIAEWHAGDPTTDLDGDLRPATDGSAEHAGADRP